MKFKGFLFDLDGTLIDSLDAVDRAWREWASRHALNGDDVLSVIHGRPARESVAELLSGSPADLIDSEVDWLERYESQDTRGTVALPGSVELLNTLNQLDIPWAIVTSGTLPVASARIKAAGLPEPAVLVTPELVTNGKPDPEPFLLGAEKLGLPAEHCVVFEDAPAGVLAGYRAKAKVVALTTHFSPGELAQAEHHIGSLQQIEITTGSDGFKLAIRD